MLLHGDHHNNGMHTVTNESPDLRVRSVQCQIVINVKKYCIVHKLSMSITELVTLTQLCINSCCLTEHEGNRLYEKALYIQLFALVFCHAALVHSSWVRPTMFSRCASLSCVGCCTHMSIASLICYTMRSVLEILESSAYPV